MTSRYVAVMRVFTAGPAGLLSDLSALLAREVAESLRDQHRLELGKDHSCRERASCRSLHAVRRCSRALSPGTR